MYSDETDVVPSAESCKDVVRQAHAAHRVDTPSQAQQRFADSEDMLRGRYGFVSYPAVDYTPKFPVMTQARVEHLLGFAPGSLPAQNHTPVSDLLGAIIQNSTQGLTNVCTIRHSSTAMSRSMVRFHIVRRKHVDGTIEEVYVIKTRHPSIEPLWDLVITDPVTVVQLLRMEEDHTIPYLVHHLVTCGISCSTAVTSNEPTIGLSHYPFPGARRMETLGWISKGHKFTHEHYHHYEFIRNMLLERDYSRAALLAGGIVGRLAKEALGVSSGTTGPSLDVYEYGSWQEYEGGAVRGDDKLSEEEQDLICGLYKVYTDDSGKQTEDASWWPKQSVWLRCGLYTGFWSADCEAWYQARSNAITTQQAQPKNAAAWKDTLKYYQRDSRIILANKTAACAQYLRNLRV
ncbi:hypothetical protein EUX98_g8139 [Antrodiella citrinella]|uniref:Uncharacterized protein n=1 Tax=Antrodiella citrinella TaxID=2447956 RepID=A0A4S4MIP0_9APHY|nr:hypothetical protein EUX98_g8139 [Antrodiella citrinella]